MASLRPLLAPPRSRRRPNFLFRGDAVPRPRSRPRKPGPRRSTSVQMLPTSVHVGPRRSTYVVDLRGPATRRRGRNPQVENGRERGILPHCAPLPTAAWMMTMRKCRKNRLNLAEVRNECCIGTPASSAKPRVLPGFGQPPGPAGAAELPEARFAHAPARARLSVGQLRPGASARPSPSAGRRPSRTVVIRAEVTAPVIRWLSTMPMTSPAIL